MPEETNPVEIPNNAWMCDDYNESLDIRESDAGVIQVRFHGVIQRHQTIEAADVPNNLYVGASQQAIDFYVGSTQKAYDVTIIAGSASTSGDKWVCVGDGIKPYQHPSTLAIRTQTWEFFSKYIDAPAGWNGGTV